MITENKFTNKYSWKNMQSSARKGLWCVHVLLKPLGNPTATVFVLMGTLLNETKINSLAPPKTHFCSHLSIQPATLREIWWRYHVTETQTLRDSLQEDGLVFHTSLQGAVSPWCWIMRLCNCRQSERQSKTPRHLMLPQFLLHSSFRCSHHQQPPTYTRVHQC